MIGYLDVKSSFKVMFAIALALTAPGCSKIGETPEKPWAGFATHKQKETLQWWFSSYKSYDECIEAMNWGVTNEENKAWYTKPVGCGYSSNNYFKSMFMNIFVADMKYFECLVESKNPEIRKIKKKYGPVLKGYDNDCVNNSKNTVIYK